MNRIVVFLMIIVSIVILGSFGLATSRKGDDGDAAVYLPLIEWPADEVVLGFGETWNVTCICKEPIVWKPFDAEHSWEPPNINVSIHNTTDIKKPYGSMLSITNASALMVGRYYCVHFEKQHEDLDEMITENVASSIYVYVEDPHQLVVPLPVKYFYKNKGFVILCKPSHPDVEVELCDKIYKNCKGTSDPTKGFYTLESSYIRLEEYYCKANGMNHTAIREPTSKNFFEWLKKPTIKSNVGDNIPMGKAVRLTCSFVGNVDRNIKISWKILPNYLPAEIDNTISIRKQTRTPSDSSASSLVTRDLIIENATIEHKRTYRCEVFEGEGNTYYHNFKLHVRESPDDFVELSTAHNRTSINRWINSNGETTPIEIIIHYKSYPSNITYEWFKDYTGQIDIDEVAVYKQEKTDDYIKLRIHQPKSYNTDIYTLVVQAGTAKAMYNMSVFVHDKPSLDMDSIQAAVGDDVYFQCVSEAYPSPTVSFMVQPCKEVPWGNCPTVNSTEAEWHAATENISSIFWSIATYKLHVSGPGIMYCKANNSVGNAMTQAYLLIQNISEFMTLEIVEPKGVITVGDNVTIVCSVMIFVDPVDVTFERNGKKLPGTVTQNDSKMHKIQLTLWNVGLNHTGEIFCNVTYRRNRRPEEATFIHMEVIDAVAPHLRSGVINQTLIVDALKPIILECDVGGTPKPKITWFKDGKPFEYNKSNSTLSLIVIEYAVPTHTGRYECIAANKKGNKKLTRNVIIRIPKGI
ncbi:hemicentin-1-like [Anopheles aquasalis]|uniref:hemicentin-1-like n=1 Tax=Anopheles aquasalis TaxID=42839 RepID=UPI00215A711D|nr:hemicentin-1-like [Anopheles aquasalis]